MTEQSFLRVQDGKVTGYVGPEATEAFRAISIGSALKFYAKTGMKVNRVYTPTRMLAVASSMTGKTYKRGQYEQAGDDLIGWANEIKASLPIVEGA